MDLQFEVDKWTRGGCVIVQERTPFAEIKVDFRIIRIASKNNHKLVPRGIIVSKVRICNSDKFKMVVSTVQRAGELL
jgi:hypothetical protein